MAGGSGSFFKNCKSEKVGEEAGKGEAGGEKMTTQEEKRREEQRQESWNQGCTFLKTFFLNIYLC